MKKKPLSLGNADRAELERRITTAATGAAMRAMQEFAAERFADYTLNDSPIEVAVKWTINLTPR